MNDINRGALLNWLYAKVSCEYFSEIKEEIYRPQVVDALLTIETNDFTLSQWNYALSYIFHGTIAMESPKKIRQFLLEAKTRPECYM